MSHITANELKTKGITALENALKEDREAIISVCGKARFVVMEISQFDQLREAEIYAAWQEAKADLEKGAVATETAQVHIDAVKRDLAEDAV